MIKYFGFFAILISALVFSSEYAKRERRKSFECAEFLRFLKHLKTNISCFMRPLLECVGSFSSELLEQTGFSDAVRTGSNLDEAFSVALPNLFMAEEGKRILKKTFSEFGHSYLADELSFLEKCQSEFEDYEKNIRESSVKNIKCSSVICASLALGFIIIFL